MGDHIRDLGGFGRSLRSKFVQIQWNGELIRSSAASFCSVRERNEDTGRQETAWMSCLQVQAVQSCTLGRNDCSIAALLNVLLYQNQTMGDTQP